MTIIVTGTQTVDFGQRVHSIDEPAFRLVADAEAGDPHLINREIVVTTSHIDGGSVAMVLVDADALGQVDGINGSRYKMLARGHGETAFGVRMLGSGGIDSQGEFRITSLRGQAVGASADGVLDFTSGNWWRIQGNDAATGVVLGGGGSFTNTSFFTVMAAHRAVGVQLDGAVDFANSGHIRVAGGDRGAVAVRVWDATGGSFVNSGAIDAHASGGGVGIEVRGDGDPSNLHLFVNEGVIRADTAIAEDLRAGGGGGAVTEVDNQGRIRGDIDLGWMNDTVVNSGLIRGDVLLGEGHDTYRAEGLDSRLGGAVFGGAAGDVLTGGRFAEVLYGDDAARGPGDGSDTLQGGGGSDTLTGGGGRDDFVYGSIGDSTRHHGDLITDLEAGDTIDLSAIDADTTQDGDQAFILVPFLNGSAGELSVRYDAVHDVTLIRGDIDGDGKADLSITAAGDQLDFDGFVL